MKKHLTGYILILLTGITAFLTSCTPESCLEQNEAFLKASFYISVSGEAQAKIPDSLTVYGIGRDTSKIYSAARGINIANLPLNPVSSTTSFFIEINGVADTLILSHFSYPHLISKECGYTYYHNIDPDSVSFTMNAIDSIRTINRTITTLDEENIRIFY